MVINQFTIFFLISLLATGLQIYYSFYAWTQRPARGAAAFAMLSISIAVWLFAIAMGMIAPNAQINFFWAVIRMIAVIIVPVFWLVLALQFSDRDTPLKGKNFILLLIIPIVSILLMATTRLHGLFFTSIEIIQVEGNLLDEAWFYGPWFWVHVIYSYGLTLIGDFILIRHAIRMPRQYRLQAVSLILATTIPLVVNFALVIDLFPVVEVNYDPLGFMIASTFFYIGLFSYRMFDLKPIARSLLIQNMQDSMLVLDTDHRLVDWNPAARDLFKDISDRSVGINIGRIIPNIDDLISQHDTEEVSMFEVHVSLNYELHYFDLKISPVYRNETYLGYLLVLRDISQRKVMEQQLESLAVEDALTGLYNHRYFYEAGNHELERARRYQRQLIVIMFDVDAFKQINDTHGHLTGDMVLRDISSVCSEQLRETDIFARYGGDEFSLLMPDTGIEEAQQAAERLRMRVEQAEIRFEEKVFRVTISMGLTAFHKDDIVLQELIERADRALYQSKDKGKNSVSIILR